MINISYQKLDILFQKYKKSFTVSDSFNAFLCPTYPPLFLYFSLIFIFPEKDNAT